MESKVLNLLLSLVLLDAPSRAWAFVKYSPGSDKTVQVPATTPTLDGRVVCPVVQSLP